MSRVIFLLLAGVFATLPVSAQSAGQPVSQPNCTLTLAESPAIRGLKLGMSTEQLVSLFPEGAQEIRSSIANAQNLPNYGVVRFYFQKLDARSFATFRDRLSGVDSVSVELFDGQLAQVQVNYSGPPRGPSWPSVDAFIAKLSEAFSLPDTRVWLRIRGDSKTLKCNGFQIDASPSNGGGSISLTDTSYGNTVRQRAEADAERRRREFKP